MRTPTFIVAGAGKAGTTWLHVCLDEHPEVFVPAAKELRFFSEHFDRWLAAAPAPGPEEAASS